MKSDQAINISSAFDTIQRLKKIIEVQNHQIKELKTTLVNRGELDNKRAQFVEVCEYTVNESEYPQQYNMKRKETPASTNTEVPFPSSRVIDHY